MPSRTKEFWQAAEPWSQRKHLIVSYYLKPAIPKLRKVSPDGRVILVDGFAGRGRYEDNSPGSPIYTGQLADECRKWQNPVDLNVFNIESDDDNFRELEVCTDSWVKHGVTINLHGTFQEQFPNILKNVARSPLFVFLDPFKPTDLRFDNFETLLRRTSQTEFCIVFHTPNVRRAILQVHPQAQTDSRTRESTRLTLNSVMGGNRWESLLSLLSISNEDVLQCYISELLDRSLSSTYICVHGIKTSYNGSLKYHLIFYTHHRDGVRLMNEAFCREIEAAYIKADARVQPSLDLDDHLPAVELNQEKRILQLRNILLNIAREKPKQVWKREDLVFESIIHRFGEFLEREHLHAVNSFLYDSSPPKIRVLENGRLAKTGRWITNDNTLLEFEL